MISGRVGRINSQRRYAASHRAEVRRCNRCWSQRLPGSSCCAAGFDGNRPAMSGDSPASPVPCGQPGLRGPSPRCQKPQGLSDTRWQIRRLPRQFLPGGGSFLRHRPGRTQHHRNRNRQCRQQGRAHQGHRLALCQRTNQPRHPASPGGLAPPELEDLLGHTCPESDSSLPSP